jgi:hypothetical protein
MHYGIGDGVGSDWFSGKVKKTNRLLQHEVATKTRRKKYVKRGKGWEIPE